MERRNFLALLAAGCSPEGVVSAPIKVFGAPSRGGVILDDDDTDGFPSEGNINFPAPPIVVASWMTGLVAAGITAGRLLYAFGAHSGHSIYFGHAASLDSAVTTLSDHDAPSKYLSLGQADDDHDGFGLLALNPDWGAQGSSNDHFSSPHFILTPERSLMKLYFHATAQLTGTTDGWTHGAGVALSGPDLAAERAQIVAGLLAEDFESEPGGFVVPDGYPNAGSGTEEHITAYVATVVADVPANEIGTTWRISPLRIGMETGGAAHYLRPFVVRGDYYAISNQGELRQSQKPNGDPDPLGVSPFIQRSNQAGFIGDLHDTGQTPNLITRHWGLFQRGDHVTCGASRPQDADPNGEGEPYPDQEHLIFFSFNTSGNWSTWACTSITARMRSETADENVGVALDGAHQGATPANKRILMDPVFYPDVVAEGDNTTPIYLLYVVSEDKIKKARWNEAVLN